MTFDVVLLAAGVATLFARPRRIPLWVGPFGCALVGVATGAIAWHETRGALDALRNPLLFLLFAVPLAVLLDRVGVFAALAATLAGGRHLQLWLWILAAGVTIVFNLDAAVVLLTPLYIHIARRNGIRPEVLVFQPALLACLASNPLPVSNLTNLIVAEQLDLGAGDFVRHLALPTLLACAVGWFGYRRLAGPSAGAAQDSGVPAARGAVPAGTTTDGYDAGGGAGSGAATERGGCGGGAGEARQRDGCDAGAGSGEARKRDAGDAGKERERGGYDPGAGKERERDGSNAGWGATGDAGAGSGEARKCDAGAVDDAAALRRGLPIVAFVLIGFTVGNWVGLPA